MLSQLKPRFATRDPHDAIEELFLSRLARLVGRRAEAGLPFNAERLLHHAIYSTFVDCRDLGLEPEARAIVARVNP